MIGLAIKQVLKPPPADKIIKQMNYGTMRGINATIDEGQAAVVGTLKGKFTLRNRWFQQQTPVGIKKKKARYNETPISGEIFTKAPFLPRQDEGGTKIPYKNYLAIPITGGARRTKTSLIPKANLPRNLKNAFIITAKSGVKMLCVRKMSGRGRKRSSGVVPMYFLVKKSQIKAAHVFVEPISTVVKRRLGSNIVGEVEKALRVMR